MKASFRCLIFWEYRHDRAGIQEGAGIVQEKMTVIDLTDENTLKQFLSECRSMEQEEAQAETAEPPFRFENQISLFDTTEL